MRWVERVRCRVWNNLIRDHGGTEGCGSGQIVAYGHKLREECTKSDGVSHRDDDNVGDARILFFQIGTGIRGASSA